MGGGEFGEKVVDTAEVVMYNREYKRSQIKNNIKFKTNIERKMLCQKLQSRLPSSAS